MVDICPEVVQSFLYEISAVVVLVCTYLVFRSLSRPHGIPPGPLGFPVFGNLSFGSRNKYHHFLQLSKTYGPIFSLYFGSELVVVLQDYTSIREAFVIKGEVYSGRPRNTAMGKLMEDDQNGIAIVDGLPWKEHRRFAVTVFKEFGIGKSSLEPKMLVEIAAFLKEIDKQKGQAFNIHELCTMSICNNICLFEFGQRFDYSDPRFKALIRRIMEFPTVFSNSLVHQLFPWIRFIPWTERIHHYEDIVNWWTENRRFVTEIIEEHDVAAPGESWDYIHAFSDERKRREQTGTHAEFFNESALNTNLRTLFNAGTETTSTTILWAILFLMVHPDVQRKVQQELDDVIGQDRAPAYDDRLLMPYTEATIHEVHRRGSVVPFSLARSTLEEDNLQGYRIPKRTTIIPNLMAVHHDEKIFPDPFTFRPERFINKQGQFVKSEYVIPFSIGRRNCVGEALAAMEVFLYLTSLLQKFTLVKVEGDSLTTERNATVTNSPKPFSLRAIARDD